MFNDFSIKLFNENNTILNILILKKIKENIYSDNKADNVYSDTSYINYKLAAVEEIVNLGTDFLYKVNYSNKIKGYIHTNDCLLFLPKEREQIRFKDDVQYLNNLNRNFDLKSDKFGEAKYKICYSKSRVLYENEIFESIYFGDIFIGFFKTADLYKLTKLARNFKIVEESTLYKDSFLSREALITKPTKTTFKSTMVIKELDLVRFKLNGKNLWMDLKHTDLIQDGTYPHILTPSDTLIQSIVFQYKDKLEKSHEYYYKLLTQELRKKGEH